MCPLQAFFSVKSLLAKSVIKLSVLIKVVYNVTSICIYSRYVYLAQTQEKNEGQKDKCFKLINILSVRETKGGGGGPHFYSRWVCRGNLASLKLKPWSVT